MKLISGLGTVKGRQGAVRKMIRDFFRHRCFYCGTNQSFAFQLDHFQPFHDNPHDDPYNLILCCRACNLVKGQASFKTVFHAVNRIQLTRKVYGPNYQPFITAPFDVPELSEDLSAHAQVAKVLLWQVPNFSLFCTADFGSEIIFSTNRRRSKGRQLNVPVE